MKIIEKILERFLGFFTIFDVSYMISGIATLSIVLWGLFKCQGLLWNDTSNPKQLSDFLRDMHHIMMKARKNMA